MASVEMSSVTGKEIEEARMLSGLISAKWPSPAKIIWMMLGEITDNLQVVRKSSEALMDQTTGAMLSQTICLSKVLERMLEAGREKFNVCDSVPTLSSLPTDVKWPGQLNGIKDKWIPPSASSKEAICSVITEILEEMWREETLIMYGFPLNDFFCIEFLFLIAHLFDKVGLVSPDGSCTTFIFFGFQRVNRQFERTLQCVRTWMKSCNPNEVSIVFSSNFKENLNEFIKISSIMECLCLKNRINDILSNIDKTTVHKNKIDTNSLEEEFAKLDCHDDEGKCISPECAKVRVNGCSKTKSIVSCEKLRNKVELYLHYSRGIDLDCSENSIWLDFSGFCFSALEILFGPPSTFNEIEEIYKYCLRQLLQCHQNLCQIFEKCLQLTEKEIWESSCFSKDVMDTIKTRMVKYSWSSSPLEVIVMDFGKQLWMNVKNHKALHNETLERVVSALGELWKDECLELRGFPLLTDFSVSVLFVLCHLFDKVRLYHSHSGINTIILIGLKDNPTKVEEVRRHFKAATLAANSIRSFVPLKNIFGGPFFEKIRNANNASIRKQCIFMSSMLLSS